MKQKDSQEKLLQFRILEARLETLLKQRDFVANKMLELEGTISSVEEISKAKGEVNFHVGGEVFVPAKPMPNENVIVMIGADVALEKPILEAKKLLESRRTEIEGGLKSVQKEIETITKQLEEMVPEIEAAHGH